MVSMYQELQSQTSEILFLFLNYKKRSDLKTTSWDKYLGDSTKYEKSFGLGVQKINKSKCIFYPLLGIKTK